MLKSCSCTISLGTAFLCLINLAKNVCKKQFTLANGCLNLNEWFDLDLTKNNKLCVVQDNEKLGSITSDIKAGKGLLCFYLNSHIIGFHPHAQVTCRTTCT